MKAVFKVSAAAVVLAVVFGLSLLAWMRGVEKRYELVEAPRAKKDLTAPLTLKLGDIEMVKVPKAALPRKAILSADKLVGAMLTRSLASGAWFTNLDLVYERDPGSDAALAPPGAVALLLPNGWFLGPLPKIKANDWLQVFVPGSNKNGEARASFSKTWLVLRVANGKEDLPSSVLVAMSANDAGDLARIRAGQWPMVGAVVSVGVTIDAMPTASSTN